MSSSNQIARNTFFLYIRMIIIMLVNLYTVRVVLNVLGAEDYGIYNVVGGLVALFSFLSGTLASSSQRFFAYELGTQKYKALNQIFSLNITLIVVFLCIVILFAETIGLWFVNSKLTIPADRMSAANWIYQFTILSFIVNILAVPYNALIIAYERMKAFAYISIIEAFFKIGCVIILIYIDFDKLKSYAVLMFLVSACICFSYFLYCRIYFTTSKYRFYWNKQQAFELLSYSGWHFFGSTSSVIKMHGINILLNIFFNPVVNAARAIAFQVNAAITSLSSNFFLAVKPQIYKFYSLSEIEKMMKLVFQSSKFSFYLMLFLVTPICLETPFILVQWLKTIPEYTILFVRLVTINALIESLNGPVIASALATGKIKKFEIVTGLITMLNLPVSYMFLIVGAGPESTMIISLVIALVSIWVRAYLLKGMINFPVKSYFVNVVFVVFKILLVSIIIPIILYVFMEEGFYRLITVFVASSTSILISAYFFGLSKEEKQTVDKFLSTKILNK